MKEFGHLVKRSESNNFNHYFNIKYRYYYEDKPNWAGREKRREWENKRLDGKVRIVILAEVVRRSKKVTFVQRPEWREGWIHQISGDERTAKHKILRQKTVWSRKKRTRMHGVEWRGVRRSSPWCRPAHMRVDCDLPLEFEAHVFVSLGTASGNRICSKAFLK